MPAITREVKEEIIAKVKAGEKDAKLILALPINRSTKKGSCRSQK